MVVTAAPAWSRKKRGAASLLQVFTIYRHPVARWELQPHLESELSFSSLLTERSSVGQVLIPFSKKPLLCLQPAGWGRGRCGSSSRSGHAVFARGLCHVTSEGIINQVFPSAELHPSPPPAAINTSSVCCGLQRAFGLVFMVTLCQQVCEFGADFMGTGLCHRSSWFGARVLGGFWVLLGEKAQTAKCGVHLHCHPLPDFPAFPAGLSILIQTPVFSSSCIPFLL